MQVSSVPAVRSLEALLPLLCIQTPCQDILNDYKFKANTKIAINITICYKKYPIYCDQRCIYRCIPEPLLTRVLLLLHTLPCLLLLLFDVTESSSSEAGLLSSSSDSMSIAKA